MVRLFEHLFIYKLNKLINKQTAIGYWQNPNLGISSYNSKLNILVMHQSPHQTSTMQYLTILDKCTQIIREDRIWLRNLVKANNQDALFLFKGLPKLPNMKQLQIKLRKYINRTKERQKQQQLLRFKQNMHLPQFFETASEKTSDYHQQSRNQVHSRIPLVQNQTNAPKSSFVAKWNNYTHHAHSNNLMQNRSQVSQISGISQQNKSYQKQWINNYKPHSFNKSLNGQLANKLSGKNKSSSNLKRNNLTPSYSKQKNTLRQNNEQYENMNSTQSLGMNGRNSSKSLKQLQNKIYEELRQFQNNKTKKETEMFNKTHSQYSVQRCFQKEKPTFNFPQTQKSMNISKQNIDQILKFKLGNCDFESYKKQQSFQNQEEHSYYAKQKSQSQKKLYNDGYFPPIEQQTERDSQSQRYPEQPMRFGMTSKQQVQDRHKFTFSSFAKGSPHQLKQQVKSIYSRNHNFPSQKMQKVAQFYQNQRYRRDQNQKDFLREQNRSNFDFNNYEEPASGQNLPSSLYQSAEKKNDVDQQYIESDLHQSIMKSIEKSREQFPSELYSSNPHLNSIAAFSSQKNAIPHAPKETNQFFLPSNLQKISKFQIKTTNYAKNDESLFTSPQLLNQCRNFLKKTQQINFQNSGLANYNSSFKSSKYESPLNSQQRSFKQTFFNTHMIQFPQPITITESITKDFYQKDSISKINSLFESKNYSLNKNNTIDFQTYSKPSYFNENSFKKSQFGESSMKKQSQRGQLLTSHGVKDDQKVNVHSRKNSSLKKHCEIEQTMNALSNPTTYFNQSAHFNQLPQSYSSSAYAYSTSQFQNYPIQQMEKQPNIENVQISDLIQLQDIIDTILEANQGNIEVQSTWLKHTLDNRCIFKQKVGVVLKDILKKYVETQDVYNFIEIIGQIQGQYKKNPKYQHKKCPSRDVYLLLDIEQKGYITFDDIRNFISQLQQAEVQNLVQIRQNLMEVFQMADFMDLKRISYVNLYIIKNQDSFDKLCQDLQQFEFQIEGQE